MRKYIIIAILLGILNGCAYGHIWQDGEDWKGFFLGFGGQFKSPSGGEIQLKVMPDLNAMKWSD